MRTLSWTLGVLLLAPLARGQWDAIPYDPAQPVFEDGFLVLHENASGWNAFSPVARKWSAQAPTGSFLWGFGDWCALWQSGLTFTGYSSRFNNQATLTVNNPQFVGVHDDVAFVIDQIPGGAFELWGYSAQTNAWSSVTTVGTVTATDIVISRFVIGVKDGTQVYGFGARTGIWETFASPVPPGPLQADGNVLVADMFVQIAAFSGVRGTWVLSPFVYPTPNLMVDHNVAYVRVRGVTDFHGCAYSAYNASWAVSPVVRSVISTVSEAVTDNVVLLEDVAAAQRFEGFGARPGNWGLLTGTYVSLVHDEDYAVVELGTRELQAFSGLCGGTWQLEITCGVNTPLGNPDHLAVFEEGPLHHIFRPGENTWEPPLLLFGGPPVTVEDAVMDVRDTNFLGVPTRWPGTTTGAVVPPQAFNTVSGGSLIAHQQQTGAGTGDVYLFDERCDSWPAPFNPGAGSTLVAGRNALVSHYGTGAGAVWGYSVQRGDWTSPAAVTPLIIPPTVDENVAWMVDGSGDLWAFGTPNEGHIWFQWPNGTEYHTSGVIPGTTLAPFLAYSIQGDPTAPDFTWAWISTGKNSPGVVVGTVLGLFCLDLFNNWFLGAWGLIDADCLREKKIPLANPLPPCLQLWMQALLFDIGSATSRWGERCEPGWFF